MDIASVMAGLANARPVFHSEADFQHALVWHLRHVLPAAIVRLEFKPLPNERLYLDAWIGGEEPIALELKYLTRKHVVVWQDERFDLKDQAAQDISRYDFLKDIARLERVVDSRNGSVEGVALLLTNDSAYWKPGMRNPSVDAAFRIHEARTIGGTLSWSEQASQGTRRNREASIVLQGSYRMNWRDYSTIGAGSYGLFRYLAVRVQGPARAD